MWIPSLEHLRGYLTCHTVLMPAMLWLGVDLTTVIPCLGVSQPLIFISCNLFKIIWQELLLTPLSTHTSLIL